MSYVIAAPELMTSAATDLAGIGSNVDAAHMVAATRATSVIPAAADEVSASIAHLFSQHAANYQALAGQAAAFNDQFVQHLTAGAGSYAHADAANAALLQLPNLGSLQPPINSPLGMLFNTIGLFILAPIILTVGAGVVLVFGVALLLSYLFPTVFPNPLAALLRMAFPMGFPFGFA